MVSGLKKSGSAARISLFALTILLVLALHGTAGAQTDPATERPRRALPADPEPQEIIKVDTDLVPIDIVATDARGRLVRNLRKEDFKLFEDGTQRPIDSFAVEKIEG